MDPLQADVQPGDRFLGESFNREGLDSQGAVHQVQMGRLLGLNKVQGELVQGSDRNRDFPLAGTVPEDQG